MVEPDLAMVFTTCSSNHYETEKVMSISPKTRRLISSDSVLASSLDDCLKL